MAVREFKLPDPGEGLTEAEIVTWHVKPGDTVKVNDVIVEVETAKSLVELPVPFAGTVSALHVAEGDTVEVGTSIISIDDGASSAETPPPAEDVEEGLIGGTTSTGRTAVLVGYGVKQTEAKRRPRSMPASQPEAPTGERLRALAKPPVRKLAKDLGVDLGSLVGTGPGGVITRDDVTAASKAAEQISTPVATRAASEDVRIPIKGVRKSTADAMVRSAFSAPHVSVWLDCDVTATMQIVERLKSRREFVDLRVSPLVIVAKAVCLALRRTPELNSLWDEAAQHIVLKSSINLGIATATPRGLLVPNIKGAGSLSLVELAAAIQDVVTTARDGKTQPPDMAGGTFSITNIGVFGVDAGTPILNPGESGILCLGQISRRPWVVGDGAEERIEPRWVTTLSVSFDHRLADGAQGSTFLADVAAILRDPALALLY